MGIGPSSMDATTSSREKIRANYHSTKDMLEEMEGVLSDNKLDVLNEMIELSVIPTPKLLIKEYKKPNQNEEYPTRLVVPATNFTPGFSKGGNK